MTFLAQKKEGTIGEYRKDQCVFLQGHPADAVFFIQRGSVKLTTVSKDGKEAVLGILWAGHFTGEVCLSPEPSHLTTASASSTRKQPEESRPIFESLQHPLS